MQFAEYFDQKRQPGKIALRRKQYEVAMTGNVPLLIWLGKQYLDQSEKVEQKTTTELKRLVIDFADDDEDLSGEKSA